MHLHPKLRVPLFTNQFPDFLSKLKHVSLEIQLHYHPFSLHQVWPVDQECHYQWELVSTEFCAAAQTS